MSSHDLADLDHIRRSRFKLRCAGHEFIMRVLPWREPESRLALVSLCDQIRGWALPPDEVDVVLQRCLNVLNRHTGGQLPSLTDRYLAINGDVATCVDRFHQCISDVLLYRGVRSAVVRQAIAIVESRFGDPQLSQQSVAGQVGVTASALAAAFKEHTSRPFGHFLRAHRLDRAAALLQSTNKSIKEIWVAVGYNHASNFDHDFKRHTGVTPSEYRARVIPPSGQLLVQPSSDVARPADDRAARKRIMLVDDNEGSRRSLATWLRLEGYAITEIDRGHAALRAVEAAPPDAVFVDYRLPDVDGIEVLKRLREHGTSMGVALTTGDISVYDRYEEVSCLNAMILVKPYDSHDASRTAAYLIG